MSSTCRIRRRTVLAAGLTFAMPRIGRAEGNRPPVTSLTYSPDGSKILAGSQRGVSIYDAETLREVDRFSPDMDNIHDLRFSHRGDVLAVAGGNPAEQGIVELFDWPSQKRRQRIASHDDVIDSVDFAPDDRRLVAASTDEVCSVHEWAAQKVVARFTQHSKAVRSAGFLPDGETIVSASRDETLRVWNAASGEPIRTLHNHSRDIHDLALRPSDNEALPMIASAADDSTVRFWQPTIGRMVRFAKLESEPLCIEWNGDGTSLFAGCRDGVCRQIDPVAVKVTSEQPLCDGWLYAIATSPTSNLRIVLGSAEGRIHPLQPYASASH